MNLRGGKIGELWDWTRDDLAVDLWSCLGSDKIVVVTTKRLACSRQSASSHLQDTTSPGALQCRSHMSEPTLFRVFGWDS